jgi:hypothetical protein
VNYVCVYFDYACILLIIIVLLFYFYKIFTMALKYAAIHVLRPFAVSIPDEQPEELQTLLYLSNLAPPTYEGDGSLGVSTKWLTEARDG